MDNDFILYNENGSGNPKQSFPTAEAATQAAKEKLQRHADAGHFHVMQRVATVKAETRVDITVETSDKPLANAEETPEPAAV